MAAKQDKKVLPAYISYKSFTNLLDQLKERDIPGRIDRSIFGNASGSYISSMLASLRFLGLIDGDGTPSSRLADLVGSSPDARGFVLKPMVEESYEFLFDGFNLERASTGQVIEKFKEQGADGSTVSKAIGFFLSIAKDAGIKVSSHVRAPAPVRNQRRAPSKASARRPVEDYDDDVDDQPASPVTDDPELERFEIPIPGKRSAVVLIPRDLEEGDWLMLTAMFEAYVKRLRERSKAPNGGDT